MGELCAMRNIGSEMERKLNAVDIFTPQALASTGSKEAFFRIKSRYPEVCLVHLYTLQAAIDGVDIGGLPEAVKAELKKYSDNIK